jgi:hypothetical protein
MEISNILGYIILGIVIVGVIFAAIKSLFFR